MTHIFVFFHKILFDEIYKDVPQDILDKHFTFIAVNEAVNKQYTEGKYNVVKEWELPIYDPQLQALGYDENSAINHIYLNKLHEKYSHIGFLQYDMSFGQEFINILLDENKKDYYAYSPCDFEFAFIRSVDGSQYESMRRVAQDYEEHYKTKIDIKKKFPLCNTYLISKEIYTNMMEWFYPLTYKMMGSANNNARIGGLFERASALVLGDKNEAPEPMPIIHNHDYKREVYTN